MVQLNAQLYFHVNQIRNAKNNIFFCNILFKGPQ